MPMIGKLRAPLLCATLAVTLSGCIGLGGKTPPFLLTLDPDTAPQAGAARTAAEAAKRAMAIRESFRRGCCFMWRSMPARRRRPVGAHIADVALHFRGSAPPARRMGDHPPPFPEEIPSPKCWRQRLRASRHAADFSLGPSRGRWSSDRL